MQRESQRGQRARLRHRNIAVRPPRQDLGQLDTHSIHATSRIMRHSCGILWGSLVRSQGRNTCCAQKHPGSAGRQRSSPRGHPLLCQQQQHDRVGQWQYSHLNRHCMGGQWFHSHLNRLYHTQQHTHKGRTHITHSNTHTREEHNTCSSE